ncbi:DHH phosphoesterase [Calocera cornea HHB12733]|uniref:DHH phosphoesterase n=1 Tax=Calocera cornea HHB12733 TaxID=1353952 RepID=A0A165I2K5_9BASI|nr:DHH phosphoesterase [Calocera cornea HHB12733]
MGALSQFLKEQKHLFLADVAANNLGRWTVVTGNEAGDLDTQASAIAYAYLTTTLLQQPTIAFSRTARADLHLRPENTFAFQRAGVDPTDLLCVDDLPHPLPALPKMALVDHNRLGPEFSQGAEVVGIIDHHDDEHLYPTANPRVILPPTQAGSCTSLVTSHFRALWEQHLSDVPGEIAFLLLCTILIDTGALKADGKAQPVDRQAAAFLMPLAGFPAPASLSADAVPPEVEELATELITKKFDVGRLSTRDLLRRDYKEYTVSGEGEGGKKVQLGLATVPLGLKLWADKDPKLWEGVDAYIHERGLDVCGLLTTFRTANKGKHRREVVLVLRPAGNAELLRLLEEGLEGSAELSLVREPKKEALGTATGVEGEERRRVWDQGNVKATRKQVAPLVLGVCRRYLGEV